MARTYEVQGRNGHYMIDEYHGEASRATYGTTGPFATRKLADHVAGAMTQAYRHGRDDLSLEIDTVSLPKWAS